MTEFVWMGSGNPAFAEATDVRLDVYHREFGMPEAFGTEDDGVSLHLLAKLDGQPAGYANLSRSMGDVFFTSMFAVKEDLRGKGVGTAMLQELFRKCGELGGEYLRLTTEIGTNPFFIRRGMNETGFECDVADYTVATLVYEVEEKPYDIQWSLPGGDISSALELRHQVFGTELGYANDPDELDPLAHTAVLVKDGRPVGCGRVAILPDGSCKLGKVALLAETRGTGLGRALMAVLEGKALELHHPEVFLSARVPALPFYDHMGYTPRGEEFTEGPEKHINVYKTL